MRKFISFAASLIFCSLAHAGNADSTSPVADNAKPDGAITLSGGSVAAGIGYTWGHGELKTSDQAHRFSIKGVSVVDVGAAGFDATGNVYNLESLADFSGNYVAAGAGVAVINGVDAVYLKNEHGVVIKLVANTTGLKFNLSADGVRVTLQN
jgi:hypothetical protein